MIAREPLRRLRKERSTGDYLDVSVSWLRKMRTEDKAAIAAGKAPRGPAWIAIGASIFYDQKDLDAWIELYAVPRGTGGRR